MENKTVTFTLSEISAEIEKWKNEAWEATQECKCLEEELEDMHRTLRTCLSYFKTEDQQEKFLEHLYGNSSPAAFYFIRDILTGEVD